MKIKFLIFCLVAILCVILCGCFQSGGNNNLSGQSSQDAYSADNSHLNSTSSATESTNQTQTQNFEATHKVVMTVSDYGIIELELYGKTAPLTVENFVSLAKSGYYDGLKFHRIIKDFMVQGGNGSGVDGKPQNLKSIKGEFSDNGVQNNISHLRGVISMARLGNDYNSATSQFFIVHADSTYLDGQYASFGAVTKGIEVIDKLADVPSQYYTGSVAVADQPVITSVAVTEIG